MRLYACPMRDLRAEDPADLVLAWEAVEELLTAVPEDAVKDVLRMLAAGLPPDEIAERLGRDVADVTALVARGRIRILTAAVAERRLADPELSGSAREPAGDPGDAPSS